MSSVEMSQAYHSATTTGAGARAGTGGGAHPAVSGGAARARLSGPREARRRRGGGWAFDAAVAARAKGLEVPGKRPAIGGHL